jgi:peptide/nickel transport system ATP-binding protein
VIAVLEPEGAGLADWTPGEPIIELRRLTVDYGTGERRTRAVNGIDLTIRVGEIVGLAGESGCGKTTVGNTIMQILRPPAHIAAGSVVFRGEDLSVRSRERLRRYRWQNVSMVFQSAMNALNPVTRVGDQFVDMMRAHERISRRAAQSRAGELLELVGIDRGRVRGYPHELSGGMRQRVIIAMALALEPELIIMDEPTTALDVVVQREILQQVEDLQKEHGFAVLFITHDLSLLIEFAHRIAIMYAGEIVESAPAAELHSNPQHPYTRGLMASFPPLTGPMERLVGIPGSPPDLADPPAGCRFHPRCPLCVPGGDAYVRQTTEQPLLRQIEPGHEVACHLADGRRAEVPAWPAPERESPS